MKWFNQKDIPGIHTAMVDGTKSQLGLDGIPALNGEIPGLLGQKSKNPPLKENDSTGNGHATHGADKDNKSPQSKTQPQPKPSQTPSGKGTGADIPGVGDVKKKVGGITSGLGL